MKKIAHLEVFINTQGEVVIADKNTDWGVISFDECMAEKLCKAIMETAQTIRSSENER